MRYVLSLYEDETRWNSLTPEQIGAEMAAYEAFGREAGDRILGGDALEPTASATTLRLRDGEPSLTDGPFAETKEQLGGFYVLECADLDEALAWAAKVPMAATGSVEVRPVLNYEAMGSTDPAGEASQPA